MHNIIFDTNMNCQFKSIDKYIYLLYSLKRSASSKEEDFDDMASRTTKTLTKSERILTSRNFTTQKCSEPRTSRFSLVLCSILIAAHKVI